MGDYSFFALEHINGVEFFSILMNQPAKFDSLAIFHLLKRVDSSDCENEAHRNPEMVIFCFGLF